MIRAHTNQLKKRSGDPVRIDGPSPLSIFVDEFGLSDTAPIRRPAQQPGSPAVSAPESGDSEYFSESDLEDEPAPQPTVNNNNNRPRRIVRLPARFEPYYLN